MTSKHHNVFVYSGAGSRAGPEKGCGVGPPGEGRGEIPGVGLGRVGVGATCREAWGWWEVGPPAFRGRPGAVSRESL